MKRLFYSFYNNQKKLNDIYLFDLDQNVLYSYSYLHNITNDNHFKLLKNKYSVSLIKEFSFLKNKLNNSIKINEEVFDEILNAEFNEIKGMNEKGFLQYFDLIEYIL